MGGGAGGNFGRTKGSSKREKLLKRATNQKLKNTINEMYRPNAKIGDGGLSDAIRHEIKTKQLVGGKSHIQKGIERLKNLENIYKKQNLNTTDKSIVKYLIKDLKNALGVK
ncbi:MAG: hypothetical protein E7613_07225 [Ruminococcaceae bacterium]|nr:hypothetical protein [Oscillospiraceae bacterium]